jgi:sugar/nucleoside kinase (ribokinase family)
MSRILAVGSVAYDSVETPFGARPDILAGSATYFSLAASHFTPVAVVAAVGEDFLESDLDLLRSHGVDVEAVHRLPGRTFRWAAKYSDDLSDRTTLSTELGVFADFNPTIPEAHRDVPYLFLGNIDPDLQRRVCESVAGPRLVACDTMNFWIEGRRESLLATLKGIQLLVINDQEVRLLSGKSNLVAAAAAVRAMGPRSLIVKRGEHGAVVFGDGFTFVMPALLLEDVVDPTGAGDSFAGGLVGCLAALGETNEPALRAAVAAGTVMASFTVQGFGLEGLLSATPDRIRQRHAELARLIGVRDLALPLRETR